MKMERPPLVLLAVWALTLVAATAVVRNFWGQAAVDDWYTVILWGVTIPLLAVQFRRDRK